MRSSQRGDRARQIRTLHARHVCLKSTTQDARRSGEATGSERTWSNELIHVHLFARYLHIAQTNRLLPGSPISSSTRRWKSLILSPVTHLTAIDLAKMSALPRPINATRHHPDRLSIWIVLGAVGILLFQVIFLLSCISLGISQSKARWRRLRKSGVIFVDGPAAIYTDTIRPAPTVSTFNLRQVLEASQDRSAQFEPERIPAISPPFNPRAL
jgi:hypothetical protein